MYQEKIECISHFIAEAEKLSNNDELEKLIDNCVEQLGDLNDTPELSILSDRLFRFARRFIGIRSDTEAVRRLAELTLEERIELEQVERIIDGNLLCYHFQPIVSAEDGSVYSYEALMRPIGSPLISPFHILKYAALTERLKDIERATFMNVLKLIDSEPQRFFGKMVFINSIPNIVLPAEDNELIGELLARNCDRAVIEMTESSELDERKFALIRQKYRTLNIRIAIDDYGTGYSNVKNLLNYMPNYVKIDRSLLSEIQNSQKKRHFVRDIIEFCHDNGILALAEGVETSEELRTVILLGVDLIQGFYTGRPMPEPVEHINEEIIAEIRRCSTELKDGIASKQYVAADGEKILLDKVVRDGCSTVLVGKGFQPGARVMLAGSHVNETNVCIMTTKDFEGTVAIENVKLHALKNMPCFMLADGCNMKLEIIGENFLSGGGVCVPKRSRLEVVGHGSLTIEVDNSDYYGIGNDLSSYHGDLVFTHNSMITITANGQCGVGIGSGSGGKVKICSGKYLISQQGGYGVSIGSLGETTELDIHDCDLETKLSTAKGTSIGSLYGSADVRIRRSSFRCFAGGLTVAGIGSADGNAIKAVFDNCNVSLDVRADDMTAVGSYNGDSDISISKASFRVSAAGNNALAFGGLNGKTKLSIRNADVGVDLSTSLGACTYADRKDITLDGGRCVFKVNGSEQDL